MEGDLERYKCYHGYQTYCERTKGTGVGGDRILV